MFSLFVTSGSGSLPSYVCFCPLCFSLFVIVSAFDNLTVESVLKTPETDCVLDLPGITLVSHILDITFVNTYLLSNVMFVDLYCSGLRA